jgi:hypothetical protein
MIFRGIARALPAVLGVRHISPFVDLIGTGSRIGDDARLSVSSGCFCARSDWHMQIRRQRRRGIKTRGSAAQAGAPGLS